MQLVNEVLKNEKRLTFHSQFNFYYSLAKCCRRFPPPAAGTSASTIAILIKLTELVSGAKKTRLISQVDKYINFRLSDCRDVF